MQVYVQKWTRTTFPRRADAVSGGGLSQASARSREASPDWLAMGPLPGPWKNAVSWPVGVVGCAMLVSPTKATIGAAIAMASTAAINSLFLFIFFSDDVDVFTSLLVCS